MGHGPFSHALEDTVIPGVQHESLSLMIMQQLNKTMNGDLSLASDIFINKFMQQRIAITGWNQPGNPAGYASASN